MTQLLEWNEKKILTVMDSMIIDGKIKEKKEKEKF